MFICTHFLGVTIPLTTSFNAAPTRSIVYWMKRHVVFWQLWLGESIRCVRGRKSKKFSPFWPFCCETNEVDWVGSHPMHRCGPLMPVVNYDINLTRFSRTEKWIDLKRNAAAWKSTRRASPTCPIFLALKWPFCTDLTIIAKIVHWLGKLQIEKK